MLRRALVLSGGGCRGAFEVGVVEYLMVELGYDFHVFLGTSVGALNVAVLGQVDRTQERLVCLERLKKLWLGIHGNKDVYHGGFLAPVRLLRDNALYNPLGLKRIIERHVIIDDLFSGRSIVKISAVALENGELFYADTRDTSLCTVYREYTLASASIPLLFPSVPIQGKRWYDGSLRDVTPLGTVFQEEPDEIVVVVTYPLTPELHPVLTPFKSGGPIRIGLRNIEIVLSEIGANDLQLAEAVNRAPNWYGRRRIPIKVIAPTGFLRGRSALDFDPLRIRENMARGYEAAKTAIVLDGSGTMKRIPMERERNKYGGMIQKRSLR